ncbi:MAG: AAA family ATPase [Leptospiraceae bacterium]|nr:AAA family ATPase [Leptospiraceae bacterium]
MITVKKDYNEIPEVLLSEEANTFRQQWINSRKKNLPIKINKSIYSDDQVYQALDSIYQGKCAMCESKVNSQGIISHYRPTSLYPWLAYEWSNLYLLCYECNKSKREQFPIEDEKKRIKAPNQNINNWVATSMEHEGECPMLMNPEIHAVEKILEIKKDGILDYSTEYYEMSLDSEKTIEVFNLNRPFLVSQRLKIIELNNNLLLRNIERFLSNNTKSLGYNEFAKLLDSYFNDYFTKLNSNKFPFNEFSLVHKSYYENLQKFVSHLIKDKKIKLIIILFIKKYYLYDRKDIRILRELKNFIEQSDSNPKSVKLDNLKPIENVYIQSLTIKDFYSIKSISISDLKDIKEVYFLGENGDGKTLLLQSILFALKNKFISYADNEFSAKAKDTLQKSHFKFELISSDETKYDIETEHYFKNVFAYGCNRSRNDSDKKEKYGFMSLFDSETYLNNPVKWLQHLHHKDLENQVKNNGNHFIGLNIAIELLKAILDKSNELEINVSSEKVEFKEKGSSEIPFENLSEGYKTTIVWVCDLLSRLVENQPKVTDLKDFEGIVLVDEIDLHLHPKWARSIVSKLRSWFPKIQFFFTTHNPITLLGVSRDACIYKLYKEDGITKIVKPIESIMDLTVNTILTSPLFDLEDALPEKFDYEEDDLRTEDNYLISTIYKEIKKHHKPTKNFTEEQLIELVNEKLKNFK